MVIRPDKLWFWICQLNPWVSTKIKDQYDGGLQEHGAT